MLQSPFLICGVLGLVELCSQKEKGEADSHLCRRMQNDQERYRPLPIMWFSRFCWHA